MRRALFVCVQNSFRSQMAEGYFNAKPPENWTAQSAGINPADNVHPNAVKLMLEDGIDISHQQPKLLTREIEESADIAVIVCSGSDCPVIYVDKIEEWSMPDPARMPYSEARVVRDKIREKVKELIKRLDSIS